jgi:hypothetical protein
MKKGDQKDLAISAMKEMKEEICVAAERRRKLRRRYQKNFEEAEAMLESRIRLLEAPEMAERMKYQLRTWMLHVKEKKGKLPEIPKKDFGGSRLLFCPRTLPPEILEKVKEAESGKKKKKKKKPKEKKKPKKDKKKKKKKKDALPEKLEPMAHMEDAIKLNKQYNKEWRHRDETHNPEQKHEDDIIIRIKRKLVGDETRAQVRELLEISSPGKYQISKA